MRIGAAAGTGGGTGAAVAAGAAGGNALFGSRGGTVGGMIGAPTGPLPNPSASASFWPCDFGASRREGGPLWGESEGGGVVVTGWAVGVYAGGRTSSG